LPLSSCLFFLFLCQVCFLAFRTAASSSPCLQQAALHPPLSKLDRLPGGRQNLLTQPSNAGANEKGSAGRHSTSSTMAAADLFPVHLPSWVCAAHAQVSECGGRHWLLVPLLRFDVSPSPSFISVSKKYFSIVLARLHLHRRIDCPLSVACSPAQLLLKISGLLDALSYTTCMQQACVCTLHDGAASQLGPPDKSRLTPPERPILSIVQSTSTKMAPPRSSCLSALGILFGPFVSCLCLGSGWEVRILVLFALPSATRPPLIVGRCSRCDSGDTGWRSASERRMEDCA
jgi:hypothetical protein